MAVKTITVDIEADDLLSRQKQAPLVTRHRTRFSRVPGLRLIDC